MLYRGCRHAEEGRLLTQSAPSRTPTDPRPPPPPPPPPAPPSGMIGRTPGQPSRIGREAEAIRRTHSGITRIASSRRQIHSGIEMAMMNRSHPLRSGIEMTMKGKSPPPSGTGRKPMRGLQSPVGIELTMGTQRPGPAPPGFTRRVIRVPRRPLPPEGRTQGQGRTLPLMRRRRTRRRSPQRRGPARRTVRHT